MHRSTVLLAALLMLSFNANAQKTDYEGMVPEPTGRRRRA
jgi:hypothetical protein